MLLLIGSVAAEEELAHGDDADDADDDAADHSRIGKVDVVRKAQEEMRHLCATCERVRNDSGRVCVYTTTGRRDSEGQVLLLLVFRRDEKQQEREGGGLGKARAGSVPEVKPNEVHPHSHRMVGVSERDVASSQAKLQE